MAAGKTAFYMCMYLTRDIIGGASGFEYGKKGDQVEVIKDDQELFLVEGKERFHVREKDLSETPIPKDKPLTNGTRKVKR